MIAVYLIWCLFGLAGNPQFFLTDESFIDPVGIGLWILAIFTQAVSVYASIRVAADFSPNEKAGGIIYSSLMIIVFVFLSLYCVIKISSLQGLLANLSCVGVAIFSLIKVIKTHGNN